MLRDARETSNDELIETDLCIVGSGPAGISIARELRGNGYQICLLESGGRQPERRAQQLNRCQSTGYPIQLSLRARACVRGHVPVVVARRDLGLSSPGSDRLRGTTVSQVLGLALRPGSPQPLLRTGPYG